MTDNIKKFPLQFDNKYYINKPSGSEIAKIKYRIQNGEVYYVTLEKFKYAIEKGVAFSPGILKGGLKAENWTQQQVFAIDIDNENQEAEILTIDKVLSMCSEYGIKPSMYYESYSHTVLKPRFRLIFVMDEIITIEEQRRNIIETLVSLFPQADQSCTNADRIFFGTNKEVKIL